VVGEGHRRQQLEALRREKGLEDLVEFTGWVRNAAARALPAFDIFFQPSYWEAMSIAVLEAMAAGKAIVATKVGENPYLIEHARDGLLLEVRDVAGMAASLRQLVGDPGLRTRLGEAAARKVRQGFTVADMTRAYEAIYAESVATRGRVRLGAAAAGKPSTSDRAAARPEIPAERRTS
jgi:glycosyltransferase involved in cell wall biosynthesis